MKKFLYIIAAIFMAIIPTSCLQSGLEHLDEFSGCDITNGNVYWCYYGTEKNPASGEPVVKLGFYFYFYDITKGRYAFIEKFKCLFLHQLIKN